jgi:hypothetical protein
MALTEQQAQTLEQYGDLYRELRQKDLFGGIGGTLAAIGDIVSGKATASSLISRHSPSMSEAERASAKRELLETLRNYQSDRRADITDREKKRLEELRTQYGEAAGQKKWALEQHAALLKQQMGNITSVQTAKIGALSGQRSTLMSEFRTQGLDVGEALNRGRRPTANQSMANMNQATHQRVQEFVAKIDRMLNANQAPSAEQITTVFNDTVGVPAQGQAVHVMNFLHVMVGNKLGSNWDNALKEGTLKTAKTRANTEGAALRTRYRTWKADIDGVENDIRRIGGPGVNRQWLEQVQAISNETDEQTQDRVQQMLAAMPSDLTTQATETALPEDEFTRSIYAQLERLDDPRYLFSGSRHERMRTEIMSSPEFKQFMAEKADGGVLNPDHAFTMLMDETKNGLEIAPETNQIVQAASNPVSTAFEQQHGVLGAVGFDQDTVSRKPFGDIPDDPISTSLNLQPHLLPQTLEKNRALVEGWNPETDLSKVYSQGRKRQQRENLTRSLGWDSPTSSNIDSTLLASRSALHSGALQSLLEKEKKDQ